MRSVRFEDCVSCLASLAESPLAEEPYVRLKKCYESLGMKEEAEAISFLIYNKFNADSPDTSEKQ